MSKPIFSFHTETKFGISHSNPEMKPHVEKWSKTSEPFAKYSQDVVTAKTENTIEIYIPLTTYVYKIIEVIINQ